MRLTLAPRSGSGSGLPRSVPPSARQRTHTTRIITRPDMPTRHRRRATTIQPHPTIPEGAAGSRTGAITTPAERIGGAPLATAGLLLEGHWELTGTLS